MERRTEKIRIRLTRQELEHLKKCSGSFSELQFKNGRENFSAYLRDKLLKETNYKNGSVERRMKELQYELRKIGTNVNQIARKVNGDLGTRGDVEELKQYLRSIENAFEKFQKEVDEWQLLN